MSSRISKSTALGYLILLMILFTGCKKARFEVDFQLPESINTTYTLVYYASTKHEGLYIEQPIPVNTGKGELVCATGNPCIVYLCNGGNAPFLSFYARRGDKISITGTEADPLTWKISGNKINEEWSNWRNTHREALHAGPDAINKAVAEYVEKNPDSELSPLLLLCEYYRANDNATFNRLWMMLPEKRRDEKLYGLIARGDLFSEPGNPQLSDVVVRSINGADTLLFKHPAFLMFWNNGQQERRQCVDTLRSLSRAYPDTARRLLADICFEPDSLSWRAPLSTDSLRGVIRGWMPLGQADKWVMNAGVNATPSFIVAAPGGKIVYSGRDINKASSIFRKEMNNKR